MFRQKSGISPTALLIGSSILIAALSPEIRRKISGMVSGRMQHKDGTHSMQPADLIQQAFSGESGGQQHTDKARHSQTGSMQPAELIKQAFGGESGGQQHEQTSRNHSGSSHTDGQADRSKETSPKPHYTEPIHFEESAVNVLNDSTVMNMLEEIEPGNH
ncbi:MULTISPECIES: hypothetical protein [Bacillus amyloliquefaciens group]|uniref:hypothetical protein n=1 Tax=Bacillus amyloliquefaciens group TaxID=1938374 RepID=UPI000241606B|nr:MULTISPECIES: hypothetical protein [Bacillus amyloliquefaciens group]AGF28521.1 hypothetical protein KSO_015170 [Bacillus amyloliquefaciens IT-45]AMP32512.1 hypothetical protein AS588_10880 [Bacillus amyloliquefaciens]ERK82644.1 hypothetical protein N786_14215 [Bacillus amyloliquefaciens UASWS BA1]MBH5314960.1 hypothetical protein [Bacillus velezensis]MDQ1915600.1 hypothetical protein [Bacillus velezensis]